MKLELTKRCQSRIQKMKSLKLSYNLMRYRPKSCQVDQGTITKQAIDGILLSRSKKTHYGIVVESMDKIRA